jgi:hypothetical protein
MRPIDDPWVMAGPLFQPIRGILFGIVFYLLREVFFGRRNGWLLMWLMLVIVGILAVFGPTPGSLEGMIYTRLRWVDHLFGLPEVVLQALLLAVILFHWVNHPEKRWLTWVLGAAFVLCVTFPVLGLLVT